MEQASPLGNAAPTTSRRFGMVAFGEALIRLSPRDRGRLVDATELGVVVGGSEANVAIGARQLGMDARWVSCLPRNPLGGQVDRFLTGRGVDTEIVWTEGGRVGLYFIEVGSSPRPTRLWYDRAGSSFSRGDPDDYDWNRLLERASVFHTSGVTPALGMGPAKATVEAATHAASLGITVSFDLNYRSQLWSKDDADAFYTEVLGAVDMLFCSDAELARLMKRDGDLSSLADEARRRYGIGEVVVSRRSNGTLRYAAVANGTVVESRRYAPASIDRIGAGDAAAAAYLASRTRGAELGRAVELAAAAAAWQETIPGDAPSFSNEDLENVVDGERIDVVR